MKIPVRSLTVQRWRGSPELIWSDRLSHRERRKARLQQVLKRQEERARERIPTEPLPPFTLVRLHGLELAAGVVADHVERHVVPTLSLEDIVGQRAKRDLANRQIRLLEHLAADARLKLFLKLQVAT